MAISDWPEAERPREKLLAKGAQALSDAELLAIFLRTGIKGKTAVDLARELLVQFDGLRGLLTASQTQFCTPMGLGPAKYAQLQAVLEMAKRHLAEQLHRSEPLTSPELVEQYLNMQLRDEAQEVFACLLLDTQHQILDYHVISRGTLNAAAVYPREVVKLALAKGAGAIIFAHNHPSGVAEPSQADRDITTRLTDALALVDVRVLDHFVIGDGYTVSFAHRGWL